MKDVSRPKARRLIRCQMITTQLYTVSTAGGLEDGSCKLQDVSGPPYQNAQVVLPHLQVVKTQCPGPKIQKWGAIGSQTKNLQKRGTQNTLGPKIVVMCSEL
jgi:hypothetical protein